MASLLVPNFLQMYFLTVDTADGRYVMPMRYTWIAIGLTALCNGCSCSPTSIAPARIPNGGRTLSIAVSSTNDQRIVAATETGGLFRTFDGGESWQHLDGLPNYMTVDVAIAATSQSTIIATTRSQYRTTNDGGIPIH